MEPSSGDLHKEPSSRDLRTEPLSGDLRMVPLLRELLQLAFTKEHSPLYLVRDPCPNTDIEVAAHKPSLPGLETQLLKAQTSLSNIERASERDNHMQVPKGLVDQASTRSMVQNYIE